MKVLIYRLYYVEGIENLEPSDEWTINTGVFIIEIPIRCRSFSSTHLNYDFGSGRLFEYNQSYVVYTQYFHILIREFFTQCD
ncbi:unnamed protein product [Nesidiocoris tenuis]|uniref:Uncharacterized protein n=1 Tax=Nesidiocoris tenuis TaxID=355587 RepID=A0A6H5HII1_9HEMI|nr:unnamed protein product [Nesidiocoris tenuis]CAB0016540.1 unnamed protein product [Nesidiocoris tenuis]